MISDRQMKRTLMIELFSTTGLFLSAMAQNLQQTAAADGMYFFHCFYWHCTQTGEAGKSGRV